MNIDRVMTYLDFVAERHRIWERRQEGQPAPWTDDPILAGRKFTNVFRVLDPGSQYALKLVAQAARPRDALARAFLYRFTNLPSTWDYLHRALGGRWPDALDIEHGTVEDLLVQWRDWGEQVFSGAYIVMPNPGEKGVDKTRAVVEKTRLMLGATWPWFAQATTPAERLAALRHTPAVGDFMAQQVLTDYGYGYDIHDENEWVVLGPGSRKGLKDLGLRLHPDSVVQMQSLVHAMPDCPRLLLPDGRVRLPSLMDVQNTLCEWSKYARFMEQPHPKPYRPAHPGFQPAPALPEHW